MAYRLDDRCKVTATAPGTGAIPAASPAAAGGFIQISAITSIANGDIVPYTITDGATLFENGYGTWNSVTGLTRTTVTTNSSRNTSNINFTGAVTVFCSQIAQMETVGVPLVLTAGSGTLNVASQFGAGVRALDIELVGPGGGGAGGVGGGSGGAGSAATTIAGFSGGAGQGGGIGSGQGGGGGAASGGTINIAGQQGENANNSAAINPGGTGGSTPLGSGGRCPAFGSGAAGTGNGAGGGGAASTAAGNGAGGGAGGYVRGRVANPAATLAWVVGSGGAAGTTGGAGAGGAGTDGIIIVTPIY